MRAPKRNPLFLILFSSLPLATGCGLGKQEGAHFEKASAASSYVGSSGESLDGLELDRELFDSPAFQKIAKDKSKADDRLLGTWSRVVSVSEGVSRIYTLVLSESEARFSVQCSDSEGVNSAEGSSTAFMNSKHVVVFFHGTVMSPTSHGCALTIPSMIASYSISADGASLTLNRLDGAADTYEKL